MAFGKPPESDALSYPGISGNKFDPISAMKCWSEVIKNEKNSGYVHRVLDSHGKLNFPREWAHDLSRKNACMPNYESIDEAYTMAGWKLDKYGRSQQPDVRYLIPALRKELKVSKKEKKQRRKFDDELGSHLDFSPRSVASSRSYRSLATPLRKDLLSRGTSAPSVALVASPAPPATPPPGSRRQQRTMPSTPALSVAARSTSTLGSLALPHVNSKGERTSSIGSMRRGSSRGRIAALVRSEVTSQCSEFMDVEQLC
jgi:hypothetical protein